MLSRDRVQGFSALMNAQCLSYVLAVKEEELIGRGSVIPTLASSLELAGASHFMLLWSC